MCGDMVVYLPRVYERIVSLRLMSAEFPALVGSVSGSARLHKYSDGPNFPGSNFNNDLAIDQWGTPGAPTYFLIDIEGLNKSDECAFDANGSGITNGFFAKISAPQTSINISDMQNAAISTMITPPKRTLQPTHLLFLNLIVCIFV